MSEQRISPLGSTASPFILRGAISAFATTALVIAAGIAHSQAPSRADADAMQLKIDRVAAAIETPRAATAPPLRTTFAETEINAYLALEGPAFLPPGIARPHVQLGAEGRVRSRAIVDLDGVRLARERSLLDPLAYVTGDVEVIATGRVEGSEGQGVIRYESATVGGVYVPKTVAQELLRFYTRTPEQPRGIVFDEPLALPAGIRAVNVERGAVTITQ